MRDKSYLANLVAYNTWANRTCYETVLGLPREEVMKERQTFMHSIHASLNHLLAVDLIWLAHLRGERHGFSELRPILHEDLDDLWAARQATDLAIAEYLDGLSGDALDEEISYELIGGNTGSMSRAMVFTHLALHGNYHRGWIADMFGQIPQMPSPTDLPVFERALRTTGHGAQP